MPSNKRRIVVDSESEDEEIVYVLGKKTLKSFKDFFLDSYRHALGSLDADDDEDDHALNYLHKNMYSAEDDCFDADAALELLNNEKNHVDVMAALEAGRNYDLDFEEQASYLDKDQDKELRRILRLLSRWHDMAETQKKQKK